MGDVKNAPSTCKSGHFATSLTEADHKSLRTLHASWPLSLVPNALIPFAELTRIHRPSGTMMFYYPCLYGSLLAGIFLGNPDHVGLTILDLVTANVRLFIFSFWLRGSLCAWNDVVDQDFDRQVARTRIRPLPRGAVSTSSAVVWTLVQGVLAVLTLLVVVGDPRSSTTPLSSSSTASMLSFSYSPSAEKIITYAVPFLLLHIFYPFAKRLTNYPQLVLGPALSGGLFIVFPMFGQSLDWPELDLWITAVTGGKVNGDYFGNVRNISRGADTAALIAMTGALTAWTLLYDTIYGAQDLEDDKKAGVGSTMVSWGSSARWLLRFFAFLQVISLAVVAIFIPTSTVFTAVTVGGTAISLVLMTERVELGDKQSCWWWFEKGNVLVGSVMGIGLTLQYLTAA